MESTRRPADDLLDVARVLVLLQGSILIATTIEALFFGAVFPGAGGAVLMSGMSALVILVARTRLRADRRWARRLIYAVDGLILALFAVDVVLAIVFTQALPPLVAVITQLVLPISVVTLLRRSARARVARGSVLAFGGVS